MMLSFCDASVAFCMRMTLVFPICANLNWPVAWFLYRWVAAASPNVGPIGNHAGCCIDEGHVLRWASGGEFLLILQATLGVSEIIRSKQV